MKKMYMVLADMALCTSALKDIQNLFYLMNEILDEDTDGVQNDRSKAGTFIDRLPLYRSMINVIDSRLENVSNELEKLLDTAYNLSWARDKEEGASG